MDNLFKSLSDAIPDTTDKPTQFISDHIRARRKKIAPTEKEDIIKTGIVESAIAKLIRNGDLTKLTSKTRNNSENSQQKCSDDIALKIPPPANLPEKPRIEDSNTQFSSGTNPMYFPPSKGYPAQGMYGYIPNGYYPHHPPRYPPHVQHPTKRYSKISHEEKEQIKSDITKEVIQQIKNHIYPEIKEAVNTELKSMKANMESEIINEFHNILTEKIKQIENTIQKKIDDINLQLAQAGVTPMQNGGPDPNWPGFCTMYINDGGKTPFKGFMEWKRQHGL